MDLDPFGSDPNSHRSAEPLDGSPGFDGYTVPSSTYDWADDLDLGIPVWAYPIPIDPADDLFSVPIAPVAPAGDELPNFDPLAPHGVVVGEPTDAMDHWHQQERPDSCAIVAQEFILDALGGRDFTEDELVQQATANGWYTPGGGTAPDDVGRLLEANGVPIVRSEDASLVDLEARLADGQLVIVGVDADEIWDAGRNAWSDDGSGDYVYQPSGPVWQPGADANHAVQVIGIDRSDPNNPMVILNDPGHPEGQGLLVPLAEFEGAWADADHFMIHTLQAPDPSAAEDGIGIGDVAATLVLGATAAAAPFAVTALAGKAVATDDEQLVV